ncbi:hypothetical protein H0X10_02015 [Candidatus Saccharibacteria bacterium]|nr:hypothetical protein [Candidatus Saccharibacteria bacterium]
MFKLSQQKYRVGRIPTGEIVLGSDCDVSYDKEFQDPVTTGEALGSISVQSFINSELSQELEAAEN